MRNPGGCEFWDIFIDNRGNRAELFCESGRGCPELRRKEGATHPEPFDRLWAFSVRKKGVACEETIPDNETPGC
jgi:hypothetical protein